MEKIRGIVETVLTSHYKIRMMEGRAAGNIHNFLKKNATRTSLSGAEAPSATTVADRAATVADRAATVADRAATGSPDVATSEAASDFCGNFAF